MKKKFFLTVFVIACTFTTFCQQLPLGTCGIVNTHDASGNRPAVFIFVTTVKRLSLITKSEIELKDKS